jgi:hypothetical protein
MDDHRRLNGQTRDGHPFHALGDPGMPAETWRALEALVSHICNMSPAEVARVVESARADLDAPFCAKEDHDG